jgi:hypothetical protein
MTAYRITKAFIIISAQSNMAKKKRNHSAASPSAASATTTVSNSKEPPIISSKKQHKKKKQKKRHNNDVAAGTKNGAKHVGSSSSSQTRSLVSRLKKLRGTMASTPTPPEWSGCQTRFAAIPEFLTPENDADFNSCWKECYQGTSWFWFDSIALEIESMHSTSLDYRCQRSSLRTIFIDCANNSMYVSSYYYVCFRLLVVGTWLE